MTCEGDAGDPQSSDDHPGAEQRRTRRCTQAADVTQADRRDEKRDQQESEHDPCGSLAYDRKRPGEHGESGHLKDGGHMWSKGGRLE